MHGSCFHALTCCVRICFHFIVPCKAWYGVGVRSIEFLYVRASLRQNARKESFVCKRCDVYVSVGKRRRWWVISEHLHTHHTHSSSFVRAWRLNRQEMFVVIACTGTCYTHLRIIDSPEMEAHCKASCQPNSSPGV
jgi:hypothetical protein